MERTQAHKDRFMRSPRRRSEAVAPQPDSAAVTICPPDPRIALHAEGYEDVTWQTPGLTTGGRVLKKRVRYYG